LKLNRNEIEIKCNLFENLKTKTMCLYVNLLFTVEMDWKSEWTMRLNWMIVQCLQRLTSID